MWIPPQHICLTCLWSQPTDALCAVEGFCPGCQLDYPALPLNPSPAAVIHSLSPRHPQTHNSSHTPFMLSLSCLGPPDVRMGSGLGHLLYNLLTLYFQAKLEMDPRVSCMLGRCSFTETQLRSLGQPLCLKDLTVLFCLGEQPHHPHPSPIQAGNSCS